jgi:hypothetical protein
MQSACIVLYCCLCGLCGSIIFFHIISQMARFSTTTKKKNVIEHRMCVLIFSTTFVWNIILIEVKGKGKVHPRTGHEGPEGEKRYSSTLSLTSALNGGGWSMPRPGRFTPGKETPYPLYRMLGGRHGLSGRVRNISPPTGIRSPDLPARSESLYRLSYPGHSHRGTIIKCPLFLSHFN